jgi:hypothetical protein
MLFVSPAGATMRAAEPRGSSRRFAPGGPKEWWIADGA